MRGCYEGAAVPVDGSAFSRQFCSESARGPYEGAAETVSRSAFSRQFCSESARGPYEGAAETVFRSAFSRQICSESDHVILPNMGGARRGVKHAVCLFQHDGALADVLIRLMMRRRARVSISLPEGGRLAGL